MQALSTTLASDGMEAARRACGGHGYSLLSGLPTLFTHYVQNVTWEGDNNVMLLQVCCASPRDSQMATPQLAHICKVCALFAVPATWHIYMAVQVYTYITLGRTGQAVSEHVRVFKSHNSEQSLWLQTARYLVKRLLAAQSGKGSPGGSAGYTANVAAELKQRCSVRSPRDWLDPAVQSAAFRCCSPPILLLLLSTPICTLLGEILTT